MRTAQTRATQVLPWYPKIEQNKVDKGSYLNKGGTSLVTKIEENHLDGLSALVLYAT